MKGVKWLFAGVLLLGVSFVLTACGGGGSSSPPPPPPTYSISGTVTSAPTGTALSGVTMSLISSSGTVTTSTAANGTYSFSGLANGTYTVTPGKPGYAFNPLNQSVTVSGANAASINFTAQSAAATYTISGTITVSGGGALSGATVNLTGDNTATVTTNASGVYTIAGLVNGAYTVTPSNSGYTFSPTSASVTIASGNQTANFTATAIPTTFSISGTVSGAVTQGVTINLSGAVIASTTTGTGGTYTFSGLANGSYTVTPILTGYTFSPTNRSVTLSGADVTGQNFTATAVTYSISGTVSGATTTSVTMTLTGAAGATTTTDSGGNYSFAGLSNGIYTVTPSKTGYTFNPTSTAVTISNANQTGKNFVSTAVGPSATYSISGSVNISGGGALSGVAVDLTGDNSGTTTTDATGAYTFSNLVAGSYVVTPSMPGWNFGPGSISMLISNFNRTGMDFTASSAVASYSISGTVAYAGSKTGRIYVNVEWSGGGSTSSGTSIAAPGSFTIRGVPNGTYTIYAWRDTLNNGAQNIANPSGRSVATYTVNSANITGASVTMADPSVPLPSTPTGVGAFPMPNGAAVLWDTVPNPVGDGNGATAYKVYWGTDGSTFPNSVTVVETDNGVYFHSGLTNGQTLYYKVSSLIGSGESALSPAVGPITIGAPAGGVSVSGQVTFTGSAAGHRMWVLLVDELNGQFFGTNVLSPTSPYSYTISGVQPGSYFAVAFVDMDDDGNFTLGDKMPMFDVLPRFDVAGANLTGKNVTLPAGNSVASAQTTHELNGANDNYNLSVRTEGVSKRVVKATVMSGPNIPLPADMGNSWGQIQGWFSLQTTAPTVGDAYTIDVTYSDGATESLTASVTGVLGTDNMATPASPTGTGASITPTFTWTAPTTPPGGTYTYDVGIQSQGGGNWIWSYPDSGPEGGLPSSQTSVAYNVDGSANMTSLAPNTSYDWWIQVSDSNGNQARKFATFTTSAAIYSISGAITNNNADQTSAILIGACIDAEATTCNYGTGIAGGAGGAYTIPNVPAGTYYVGACVDTNGDMACDLASEPFAVYASNPVTITTVSSTGINMTIP